MKHKSFFKLLLAIVFCSVNSLSYGANPIYLSSGGNDGNDGSSSGLAVATLTQAMTLVDAGGTIIVSGMISATSETTLTKIVTIQGTSNTTDGFTGGNSARFISNAGFNLTLSNLKLTSYAASAGNGGVLLLSGGTVSITNVNFDNNKALLGGAIYASAGTITLEGCTIQNNDNSGIATSNGGGIYVKPTAAVTLTVNNSLLKNNKTAADGAAIYYLDNAAYASTMKFTNCAIVSNTSSAGAGAVYVNNPTTSATLDLSFINSTLCKNTAGGNHSGALHVVNALVGTNINLINCTITENKVTGTTGASGAGVRYLKTTVASTRRIYNTIIENNTALTDPLTSINNYADFAVQDVSTGVTAYTTGSTLIILKSIIGRTLLGTTALANTNFGTGNLINHVALASGSYSASFKAKFGTFNSTYNFYPLLSNSSALGYGASTQLTSLTPSITTDQIGNTRIGSTCDAGAIEQSLKVSITSTSSATTSDNPIPVTITFSNSVTGFDASDITVTNGTKGTLSVVSGTTYTLNITPTAAGAVTVDIAANAATDVVGNGNVAATQFTRTYALAGSPPTVTISSSTSSTTQTNPIPVTITFSEAVTGFEIGDLNVGNGTKSNFVGSGTTYTCDITPTIQGAVTVDIAADAAINATSNGNTVATQLVRTYYKDIYLSSTGNDSNDGYTSGTAVATLSTALTKAIAGEKIYVSGLISFSSDVTLSKTITIQGISNATDGFNGNSSTRFIQASNASYTLTLKNLKLINGSTTGNGGALLVNGSIVNCENVIFDNNKAETASMTGGAVHIDNTNGLSFKNCIFSNNSASKSGAIYITTWVASTAIKFEGCAFVSNIAKESFGGSSLFIRSASDNNSLSLINCTFAKNEVRTSTNGGAVYLYKGSANTVVNIVNCTITENTTAGGLSTSAGVYMLNSTGNYLGKLYISNSIIEGNIGTGRVYTDFNTSSTAPTSTTLQINNSIIGRHGASITIPAECFGVTNQFNYLSGSSTTNDFKAGLVPFNATNNSYALYTGSMAISYGASSYLTTLSPAVLTDQLGNVRTVGATNYAGAWESTPIATTTAAAPTSLIATAGDGQTSVAFTTAATGGSNVTNYKYSTDGTNFVACSPAKTTSPIVIAGLTNGNAYTIKLKAVNANGDGTASVISNEVTPHATANDIVVSTPTNISTLALTPVSDVVVSGDVLTINQATAVNSLTVAPGAKVTVTGTNALTATNGITLESDANGTATLIDSYATPTISATVKQHVSAGRNWYVSAPVSASGVGALSRGNSVVEWNETTKAWDTKTSGNLLAGKGYIQVSNALQGTTGTVDFSGLTNSGDVAVSVSRTESGTSRGFNLVGNPYPSYIDWNGVIADSENALAGISSSFWFRTKNTLGVYVFTTYNGTSSEVVGGTTANTTINNLIPPMQAFWIKVNPNIGVTTHSTTLKFKNIMREHGLGDNNKLKAPKLNERIRLRLQLENGTSSDETLIYFDTNASDNFDAYDSPKMFNNSTSVPDLYSKSTTESLVINGLSELRDNMELPLGFGLNAAATLRLKATELTNFPIGTHIYLIDKGTQTQQELVVGEPYTFNTSGSTVNNESRFSIIVRAPKVTTSTEQNSDSKIIANVNANGQIVLLAAVKSNYAIYNALGMMLENGVTTSNNQTLNFKLQTGVYLVKVNNVSNRVILK